MCAIIVACERGDRRVIHGRELDVLKAVAGKFFTEIRTCDMD